MAVPDETRRACDRAADVLCRDFATPVPTLSKTSEAPVVAVHDDGTLDVGYGGAVLTVRMTTACAGVSVGDTVLLTAYGQMLYATGVLARDNGHYVKEGCKVLFSNTSGVYMNASQTIALSEPLSAQAKGIVLHWQAYIPGTGVQNYWHNYAFVPRTHAEREPGEGVSMLFDCGSYLVIKYVYVGDDRITGQVANSDPAYSVQGMKLDNRRLVLTEVLGF